MAAARRASWLLLIAGLASVAYAGLQGNLDVYLLLVIPVVTGTGPWAGLGLLAAFAGLVGLFWTAATPAGLDRGPGRPRRERPEPGDEEPPVGEESSSTRGGGVILIGPIPIVWGSDRSTTRWLVAAGVLLTLAAIGLTLVLRG